MKPRQKYQEYHEHHEYHEQAEYLIEFALSAGQRKFNTI